ncbi:MAG: NAD(P)H-hydrate dehydratase [Polaromonas sp.]|nr:NAD(P)H-hydrate dehydratase [Polaromonas sp.]
MEQVTTASSWPLHGSAATRAIESQAAAGLPAHTLMQRAGAATARLALALAPHARCIWIACGPGNNGGDGFEAALRLHRAGKRVVLTWTGMATGKPFPADAQASMDAFLAAGLTVASAPPVRFDLAIDALLGLGVKPARSALPLASPSPLADWITMLRTSQAPVLSVDLPSGLDADTGADNLMHLQPSNTPTCPPAGAATLNPGQRFTLGLLTLKPGLFTAQGRDLAGEIWFDALGVTGEQAPGSQLLGGDAFRPATRQRAPHASHKGSFGDVAVIGGESTSRASMAGAALLAARAALHGGAGRVMVTLLGELAVQVDHAQPELMFRHLDALDLSTQVVVCGCGGGNAISACLPGILSTARRLVLDADGLNAVAHDTGLQTLLAARHRRGYLTVLTPHPLEAARLLGIGTADVQANRMSAATRLAEAFDCTVVLKGSGTVIVTPGHLPGINPTGNALLATAGTGDVLAGLMGAFMAAGLTAHDAACRAVFVHGQRADDWARSDSGAPLTASVLAGLRAG